ncbi:hypothetical protein L6164_035337 [Bauhinia variegata]|uniref:Uncharacterized protein n=1 Tax=Bauhinia variegata TaxID=167791 RepID=A0ACB9KDQ4_BAUVA|nr:hypothetical protein L6164_035337 [Bauhinia variegata]
MAGIALLLDLWKKNQSLNQGLHGARAFHSSGLFSASAAAASFVVGSTVASRGLFGPRIAYCDAGATLSEDYISNIRGASEKIFNHDVLRYSTKRYHIEPKPLLSAFELKTFALTSLRSFLMFYLPLLEPRPSMEDDDDNFLQDNQEQPPVDLVVPLKKSVKQIMRETTIVTTRRILERMAVHYVSERMAWKLLKDVPKSAARKAGRRMPTTVYFFCVSRTNFRGHILGAAASWIVQVGIDLYRFFTSTFKSGEVDDNVDRTQQIVVLGNKVFLATVRVSSSLVFASIGAGIGAALFRPSVGTWIGGACGDLAGPVIVAFCADKFFSVNL